MTKQILTSSIVLLSTIVLSQQLRPSKLAVRGPNDISHVVAAQKAAEFVSLIALASDDWADSTVQLAKVPRDATRRKWYVQGRKYGVYVDSLSGKILSFSHLERTYEQFKNINRNGQVRFPVQMDALNHLLGIARTCGILEVAKLHEFVYKLRNTGPDSNKAGYFAASFKRNGKVVANIECDIQDGIPVHITLPK